MIIVEGPDGGGKTELAHRLCDDLVMRYTHSGGPPKTAHDVRTSLMLCHARMKQNVVQDRVTHISEIVYAPDDSRRRLAREALRMVRDAVVVIYCRPTAIVLRDNVKSAVVKEHETLADLARIQEDPASFIKAYDIVMGFVPCPVLTFNYMSETQRFDYEQLVERINELKGYRS